MLVISRRKGQRIAIGDDIEIVITEVHRSNVKIGIKAPRGYTVLRGEVSDAISAANREAASITLERAGELASGTAADGRPQTSLERLGIRRQPTDTQSSQTRDAAPVASAAPGAATKASEAPARHESPQATAVPKPGGP